MVQGLVLLVNPNANVGELWQATLLLYCFVFMAVGFNIFCAQHLPLAEGKSWPHLHTNDRLLILLGVLLCVHVFGFFVFLLTFWIMADHAPASKVFTKFK
jgi:hypothetical protein